MSERKKRCIVTYASGWSALAATRSLGSAGVEVITGDNNLLAPGSFSKYSKHSFLYPNPEKHPEKYLRKLRDMAIKYGGDDVDMVIMPMHTDCFVVAANQDYFKAVAKLALPTFEQIKLAGNKAMLAEFCRNNNIPTPNTWKAESLADFTEHISDFSFPAFIKLQESNAALGLKKVNNPAEAEEFFRYSIKHNKLSPENYPIIQEAVPGEDYCSTFLFANGGKRAAMTYHNILDYPRNSGMGVVRETVKTPEMEAIGAHLLELLRWHGVAEIDFRWDGKNTPLLIEVNPRFWGGLGQSIAAGWNYPKMVFDLAVNGDIEPVSPVPKNTRTFNPCLHFLLMIQEFKEAKHPIAELEAAFVTLKRTFKKHHLHAVEKFVAHLGAIVNPLDRFKAVENVIRQKQDCVNEMFTRKDPLPVLGLLYPVAVFLKNGKISPEILVSESKIDKVDAAAEEISKKDN
ncbi:MAG: ATP-grasp domain-containing protein [Victivallales bacterium]|nr:ATP-grasp domain-containing protein [Victivallales bacterium]